MKLFIFGVLIGLVVIFPALAYLYVKLGFLSLATTASPMPFEEFLAKTALRESVGSAKNQTDPLPVTDENLLAGTQLYREQCAVCHGLPGQPKTLAAAGMFPIPPQLLEGHEMLTRDPEGTTFWKVTNGIRLSGMPRFDSLPDTARWQVTMMLKHADKLPAPVEAKLREPQAIH